MTVSTETRKAGPYEGNASATAFDFAFRVFTTADVQVVHTDADGVETVLTTGYTVSLNSDQDNDPGGTVTYPTSGSPLPADEYLTITSDIEETQSTQLPNASGWFPRTVERALDRLTILVQQVRGLSERGVRFPLSDRTVTRELPSAADRANRALTFDADGEMVATAALPTSSVSVTAFAETLLDDATSIAARNTLGIQGKTPADVNAIGDGASNDTTAFSTLEASYKGYTIDLLGKTYLVNSLPTECQYYNGAFKVSGTVYSMPRWPLAHPLAGQATAIAEGTDEHFWPGPVGQSSSDDVLIRTVVRGWRHNVSLGAMLGSERSYDGGITWEESRTIYCEDNREPRGLVGGMISATRYAVVYVCVDSAGTIQEMKCSYTDDDAVTWTTVAIAVTDTYPHGEFVADDSNGINIFGYGGTNIYRLRSTDSGATWAKTTAKAATVTVAQPVEPAVVKIAANKYAMLVRNDAGGDMYATTSTDLATWTAWADTNIPLGLNPPTAVVAWGRLWLYLSARRSTAISSWEDKLLVADLDPDAFYTAGGVLAAGTPLRVALAGKTAMIGYLTLAQLRDKSYIGYMIDGETVLGSANPQTTRLVRLGGYPAPLAAPAIITARRARPPITHNPTFNHWTRGTSFTGLSAGGVGPDRWMVTQATAGTVDLSRVELSDAMRRHLPGQARYGMRIQSAIGGSGRAIGQRFYQKDRVSPLLDRVVTMTALVSGTMPGYFRSRIEINFGGGGSSSVTAEADTAQRTLVGDLTLLTATTYIPNADGLTWGTDPYITFGLLQNDAGAIDAILGSLYWDWGDTSTPLDPFDLDAERAVLDRYVQKFDYGASDWVGLGRGDGASGDVEVELTFPRMISQPAITADSASKLQVGSTQLSTTAFDLISPQSARMLGHLSAGTLTAGNVGVCSVRAGQTWYYIADVGH